MVLCWWCCADGVVQIVMCLWGCVYEVVLMMLCRWCCVDGVVYMVLCRWCCVDGNVFMRLCWWGCVDDVEMVLCRWCVWWCSVAIDMLFCHQVQTPGWEIWGWRATASSCSSAWLVGRAMPSWKKCGCDGKANPHTHLLPPSALEAWETGTHAKQRNQLAGRTVSHSCQRQLHT